MDIVYRHHAFSAGLRALGYEMKGGEPIDPRPGDVLVGWNKYSNIYDTAMRFEAAGGIYLCAENGYLGPRGVSPHAMNTREWYALGRGFHNDSAVVRSSGSERFAALEVELKPWREHGSHFLICPNRTFGTPGRTMAPEWANQVRRQLKTLSKREARIRPHPGNDPARTPLADDLRNCWCAVVWNSSAGIQALVAGIPVICCAPNWICKSAALTLDGAGLRAIDWLHNDPAHADAMRLAALRHMAWSQWHVSELESGAAFRWVLGQ